MVEHTVFNTTARFVESANVMGLIAGEWPTAEQAREWCQGRKGDVFSLAQHEYEMYEDMTGLRSPSGPMKVQRRRYATEEPVLTGETRTLWYTPKKGWFWK